MIRLYQLLTRLSPARLLLLVFAGAIAGGALLLSLPVAAAPGHSISLMDALFTSASAVCVTGLIVVDTGSAFSLFGQLVILALIQAGGLGIMTFASIAFKLFGAKLPLTHQLALEDGFFQRSAAEEFSHTFPRILKMVGCIELVGFLLLFAGMSARLPAGAALYSAFFHSVSAFCNAGFSIYEDSLTSFSGNPLVMCSVMVLIILGGLGHLVLRELHVWADRLRHRDRANSSFRFSFHSRVVLLSAALLILGGTAGLLVGGVRGENGSSSLVAALFQSITARTAGFNTVNIYNLPLSALLIIVVLMFIGGAPGSCAGGIKTTSFVIWMARVRSALHGSNSVSLMGRQIPDDLVVRTAAVIGLAMAWNVAGIILLSFSLPPHIPLQDIIFEQISAFGTVGLSTGTTTELSTLGRLWIIVTMFVGRLGPLTLLLSFVVSNKPRIQYAEGRVMVG